MGLVYTEIKLKNGDDISLARSGYIKESEVRELPVQALVDTGAWTLTINEIVREELGLSFTRYDTATLADGTVVNVPIAGPVDVVWRDRRALCEAIVMADSEDILLGAIPLEALDIIVNPRTQQVEGAHGDKPLHSLKGHVLKAHRADIKK